jgi:hypothetical protein
MIKKESVGQANRYSIRDQTIFENDFSIVKRLQSRSVTGRNIQIKVHRHFDYKHFGDNIELFCAGTKIYHLGTTRTIEDYRQIRDSFYTLIGLENLCSCIDALLIRSLRTDAKLEPCIFPHHFCRLPSGARLQTRELPHIRSRYMCRITDSGYSLNWK